MTQCQCIYLNTANLHSRLELFVYMICYGLQEVRQQCAELGGVRSAMLEASELVDSENGSSVRATIH